MIDKYVKFTFNDKQLVGKVVEQSNKLLTIETQQGTVKSVVSNVEVIKGTFRREYEQTTKAYGQDFMYLEATSEDVLDVIYFELGSITESTELEDLEGKYTIADTIAYDKSDKRMIAKELNKIKKALK